MTQKTARIAFIVFFIAVVSAFFYMAWPLMKGVFLAFVVAILFFPVYQIFFRLFRRRSYLAACITTVLCFVIVLVPLSIAITMVAVQLVEFVTALASKIQTGQLDPVILALGQAIDRWMEILPKALQFEVDLRGMILDGIKHAAAFLYQFSPHMLAKTASVAFNLVILAIFMVVFFAEGPHLFAWLLRSMPISVRYQKEISREIRNMITALLLGMIGTAVVQGILIGLGIEIAGFSNAEMWGMLAMLAAFIPIIGAALTYLTATAILASMGQWQAALLFLLYGVAIVSSVDNVLKPLVMGSRMRVHPVLLFVALLGGVRAFGAIGVIGGPVLLAVFLAALRIYQREFAKQP
jgi:predicted PurR-regulated permease PerM